MWGTPFQRETPGGSYTCRMSCFQRITGKQGTKTHRYEPIKSRSVAERHGLRMCVQQMAMLAMWQCTLSCVTASCNKDVPTLCSRQHKLGQISGDSCVILQFQKKIPHLATWPPLVAVAITAGTRRHRWWLWQLQPPRLRSASYTLNSRSWWRGAAATARARAVPRRAAPPLGAPHKNNHSQRRGAAATAAHARALARRAAVRNACSRGSGAAGRDIREH